MKTEIEDKTPMQIAQTTIDRFARLDACEKVWVLMTLIDFMQQNPQGFLQRYGTHACNLICSISRSKD